MSPGVPAYSELYDSLTGLSSWVTEQDPVYRKIFLKIHVHYFSAERTVILLKREKFEVTLRILTDKFLLLCGSFLVLSPKPSVGVGS